MYQWYLQWYHWKEECLLFHFIIVNNPFHNYPRFVLQAKFSLQNALPEPTPHGDSLFICLCIHRPQMGDPYFYQHFCFQGCCSQEWHPIMEITKGNHSRYIDVQHVFCRGETSCCFSWWIIKDSPSKKWSESCLWTETVEEELDRVCPEKPFRIHFSNMTQKSNTKVRNSSAHLVKGHNPYCSQRLTHSISPNW